MIHERKEIVYLKLICFFKTSVFSLLIFLALKTRFSSSNLMLATFVLLFLVLALTQVFSLFFIYKGNRQEEKPFLELE
ncbi:hypothetical protein [Alkaliphilus oremlandii]|uniref:hypothetical protein n=1 Tax=Alkaliphilus oremlandii TaxID=461876 RepID=UPI0005A07C70|nr:hypothetical protein [Alkaliphilus oremlandii]